MTTKIKRAETKTSIKRDPVKLTKAQQETLDDLVESSKAWGLQQEYGNGKAVDNAEKHFNEALTAMRKLLLRQNAQLRKLKAKTRHKIPVY